jgi:GNAT superfamily N-acetyltransferase
MRHVTITPVETRSQQRRFLRLPWELYRDTPQWVPPLLQVARRQMGFVWHPFYDRGRSRSFLATRGGGDIGRITAIVNEAHNERHRERLGFFGFFECVDDAEAAEGLFTAARAWLRAEGMTAIRGPANPSLNYECGLLVDGFHLPPQFMMTYNHRWYERLILDNGFAPVQDLFAFWGTLDMLATLDPKLAAMNESVVERFGVKIRPLDTFRFAEEVATYLDIYNRSMGATWGFVPLSQSEVTSIAAELRHLIVPELALFAEIDRKPVGACFCLLDYNPRIKAISGRLFPFGFIRLLANRRAIKSMRAMTTNVIPEYQAWGIGLTLMVALLPALQEWGMREVEFSWVLESNHLSRRTLERGGALRTKTFRLYQDGEPVALA